MKTKVSCQILIFLILGSSSLFAQGFKPPAKGKSVIYFVHIKKTSNIEYFLFDKYIGVFKGKNYMRIECDPGENLFWASEENKEFVTTDLLEGGTYIVIGEAKMGAWSARVKLTTITEDDKKSVVTPQSKIKLRNSELVKFIANIMDRYENEWKDRDFPHISADMAISTEAM